MSEALPWHHVVRDEDRRGDVLRAPRPLHRGGREGGTRPERRRWTARLPQPSVAPLVPASPPRRPGARRPCVRRRVGRGARLRPRRARLAALHAVAEEAGATPNQVVIAWLLAHDVVPVVGVSSLAPLEETLAARDLKLDEPAVRRLDGVTGL